LILNLISQVLPVVMKCQIMLLLPTDKITLLQKNWVC